MKNPDLWLPPLWFLPVFCGDQPSGPLPRENGDSFYFIKKIWPAGPAATWGDLASATEELEPDFRIFANRSDGILHVIPGEINRGKTEQGEFSYSIYKLSGQMVLRDKLQDESIIISGMKDGIYIIWLCSANTMLCRLINLF